MLETLYDSVAGFDHVGEHSHLFGFYAFCERHAAERGEALRSFSRIVAAHSDKGGAHGTILGSAHRLFLDMKAAVSSGERAVIEELIRGENFLASRIDALLEQDRLPDEVYEAARRLRASVSRSLLDLEQLLAQREQQAATRGHASAEHPLMSEKAWQSKH